VVEAQHLKIEHNIGQYDRKNVINIDKEEESNSEDSDDFSKPIESEFNTITNLNVITNRLPVRDQT